MLDVAIRKPTGEVAVDLGRRAAPPLPVDPALSAILPHGLRRGSTVAVSGSVSLLLALLGTASAAGAWCALVGFPHISAEAAGEYGIELSRLAVVPALGQHQQNWTTAVGALVDAVDIVAARPPARLAPGEIRRLAARARTRDAVLIPFLPRHGAGHDTAPDWPNADVRLSAAPGPWTGIGSGHGRLRARRVEVTATGRGGFYSAARPRSAELWLPTAAGGVASAEPLAPVIPLVS
jgi:hypothetical protein